MPSRRSSSAILVLLFSFLAFVVMGYHPGIEDDSVYLAAVKHDLRPSLFPHDASFFEVQLQATIFDNAMAGFLRLTGMPVAWGELLWQSVSIVLILWSAYVIARRLFKEPVAQWAGVAMLAAMFTLPVSGTALYIADQHLHPRNLATGLILVAVAQVMARRRWLAAPSLGLAFLLHPIMGALGISFCLFLIASEMYFERTEAKAIAEPRVMASSAMALMPLGWMFEPPTDAWRKTLSSRTYYFLYRWHWYEWLGAVGPLVLFWFLARWASKRGDMRREDKALVRFAWGVLAFGVFQQIVAMIVTGPDALIRLMPLQPMRYLHLVYIFMALIAGALIGQYMLKRKVWRWAVFLVVINVGMFVGQRELFAGTEHIELPNARSGNPWLQAFEWVRQNTPENAYFVMDTQYMAAPGEDYHSFRALAERSMLTDGIKDTAVTTQVPELAVIWTQQQAAQAGWKHFKLADFERLKGQYGIDWALVSLPATPGLDCQWHNDLLTVCRIP